MSKLTIAIECEFDNDALLLLDHDDARINWDEVGGILIRATVEAIKDAKKLEDSHPSFYGPHAVERRFRDANGNTIGLTATKITAE
jgi:hypothetical protein